MNKELLINVRPYGTSVALVEDGTLVEYHMAEGSSEGVKAGDIFKGRVVRILPGMEAAFVDIGLAKNAFLYSMEVVPDKSHWNAFLPEEENIHTEDLITQNASVSIEDLLVEGQEILVQITKEPISTKGPRLTTMITLPGPNLVFLPFGNQLGVSHRITDNKERERLRNILSEIKEKGFGVIARTASEGSSYDKLQRELEFLKRLWQQIKEKAERSGTPKLIHKELDLALWAVRELFTREVDRLIVDSEEEYSRIIEYIDSFMPSLKDSVELYEGEGPLFDRYDVEIEVEKILRKKVWLKSGGYIVIEPTEALVAIDVNTGRYVGKHNLSETILKTNLEAVKEIAYQLRLRNLGGLIVIDFIDMEDPEHREKVHQTLVEILKRDTARTKVMRMSDLGLVEMTRKRIRESLEQLLTEPCEYCGGTGKLKSRKWISRQIFRKLEKMALRAPNDILRVVTNSQIAQYLLDEEQESLRYIEERTNKQIVVQASEDIYWEEFKILT